MPGSTSSSPTSSPPILWQRRWFQMLLLVLVILAIAVLIVPPLVALIYAVRSVLLPVLIGAGLAYACDPLVRWLQRRAKVPRPVSALLLMGAAVLVVLGLGLYLVPKLIQQISDLVRDLPGYLRGAAAALEIDLGDLVHQIEEAVRTRLGAGQADPDGTPEIDFGPIVRMIFDWLDVGLGVIGTTIGYVSYLALAAVVIGFVFFFFVWRFDKITAWFVPFIPVDHRARTLEIARKMDQSVSGFIRGRLIQATCVAVVLSVGWTIAGVPYALLLGVGGGVLNLIPYAAVVAWPPAVLLTWLELISVTGSAAGFDVWGVLVWPSLVYFLAQGLDGWVIEPLVQGKATNLDPLTVLLVVLVGGSLAGLLGLLIAIPAAACIKILCQEVVLPKLRAWAAQRPGAEGMPRAGP